MKSKLMLVLLATFAATASWAEKTTYTLTPTTNGTVVIRFTNNYPLPNGISTLEGRLGRKWVALQNFFTTQTVGMVELPRPSGYGEYRLRAMSVVPGNAFPHLALGYGTIQTVGGSGPAPSGTNLWRPEYEGTNATNVVFSNPRAAVADDEGRIYVVERDSHAVSVIETNGTVRTAVGLPGTRGPGFLELGTGVEFPGDGLAQLDSPSGLYYQNGTLYILDAGNGRVLRYTYTNGAVSKLFSESPVFGSPTNIANGGGLWVSPNEAEAFYTDGTMLKHWRASQLNNGFGGVNVEASGFVHLSDVKLDPRTGDPTAVDRGGNRLYRVRGPDRDFRLDPLAGNGLTRGFKVGPVANQALAGPSSLVYLPIGGYLLGLDEGARVAYVDVEDNAATLVFGRPGAHAGDGSWFRRGGRKPKVSHVQSITLAPNGDMIILEDGFVRRIKFLRAKP